MLLKTRNSHLNERSKLAACCAAVALLAAITAVQAADLTPQEKALVEDAKKEGAVVILNPQFSDHTGQMLGAGFIKRYNLGPNFNFNNLRKGTGATVAQTRQEIQAGKHTADMLIVNAPGFFDEAAKRGAFEAVDSGYWKDGVFSQGDFVRLETSQTEGIDELRKR